MEFEKNLNKLEKLVTSLENNELSIDEAMKRYREGLELAERCEKELAELKGKITILNNDYSLADGDIDE